MNDVLSKYIGVAIEILLFSLIILVIAVFSSIAKDALNTKVETNVIMNELTEYRSVYKYIELANTNSTVTGDDIVSFITEFKRKYNVQVIASGELINLDKSLSTDKDWSMGKNIEKLGASLAGNFSIKMIYDSDRNIIDKFIFEFIIE